VNAASYQKPPGQRPEAFALAERGKAARRLEAVKGMVALEINEAVRDLSDEYFAAMQLPECARPDATHLAVACWHGVEYLVTWNCGHIANARVERLVRAINDRRGIETPVICTPQELQEP